MVKQNKSPEEIIIARNILLNRVSNNNLVNLYEYIPITPYANSYPFPGQIPVPFQSSIPFLGQNPVTFQGQNPVTFQGQNPNYTYKD